MKRLTVRPASIKEASKFVGELHRHHGEPVGGKFALAAMRGRTVVGYTIVGRPVARSLDNGLVAEVTRLCTDGAENACSLLYGAAARVAKEMGYVKIVTYILESESGASLRAAGWTLEARTAGGSWDTPTRRRTDKAPTVPKLRWSRVLRPHLLERIRDLDEIVG